VQLTSGPIHWRTPIPSRDGDKIFAVGTTRRGELVQFDARTKTLQLFLGGISADFLDFSKDGTQLIYITYPDGIMWRAKADGTERVQLTSPPLRPFLCRWSPDGSQILFSANKSASRWSLFIMPARGGAPRRLLPGDDEQGEIDGHWSPDGRKIVYQIDVPHSLRILDIARGTVSKVPGSDGLWSPRWSPNGRYLAAFNAPNTAIKIFDLRTNQWSTLAERESGWGFLTFSHNSKFIYVLHGPGPWSIYRIPMPGGTPERIADLSDVPLVGALGFWFGLDPSDRPLLLRNSGTSDIYALTLDRK
jgi:Tol biopolymer transport system component